MKAEKGGYHETIEFRQHGGTLKGDRAKHWAKFCMALGDAYYHDRHESSLLSEHAQQQKGKGMATWELANFLGLNDVADAFEEFVLEKEAPSCREEAT